MNALLKSALAVAGLAVAAQASAQITFYENDGFSGRSFATSRPVGNFERFGFNDRANSVVVLSERWEVCEHERFEGRCVILRPGRYPSLSAMGLDDRVSSVRPVSRSARIDDNRFAPVAEPVYDNRRRNNERLFTANVTSVRAVVGSKFATSAPVAAKTKTPPLSAAPLGGSWTVTYTVLSSSLGNAHPGQPLRPYTWIFTSACHLSHVCGGKWTIQFRTLSDARGVVRPLNGKYQGQMRSVGLGICGSANDHMDSATATITPSKAKVVGGTWQATRFTGLLQEYLPAENGCSTSFLKAKLDGVRRH